MPHGGSLSRLEPLGAEQGREEINEQQDRHNCCQHDHDRISSYLFTAAATRRRDRDGAPDTHPSNLVTANDKGEHQAQGRQTQKDHGQNPDRQFHRTSSFSSWLFLSQRSVVRWRLDGSPLPLPPLFFNCPIMLIGAVLAQVQFLALFTVESAFHGSSRAGNSGPIWMVINRRAIASGRWPGTWSCIPPRGWSSAFFYCNCGAASSHMHNSRNLRQL